MGSILSCFKPIRQLLHKGARLCTLLYQHLSNPKHGNEMRRRAKGIYQSFSNFLHSCSLPSDDSSTVARYLFRNTTTTTPSLIELETSVGESMKMEASAKDQCLGVVEMLESMKIEPSAKDRCFGVVEMLELILLRVNPKDIMYRCRLVDRSWDDCIRGSPRLRFHCRRTFFKSVLAGVKGKRNSLEENAICGSDRLLTKLEIHPIFHANFAGIENGHFFYINGKGQLVFEFGTTRRFSEAEKKETTHFFHIDLLTRFITALLSDTITCTSDLEVPNPCEEEQALLEMWKKTLVTQPASEHLNVNAYTFDVATRSHRGSPGGVTVHDFAASILVSCSVTLKYQERRIGTKLTTMREAVLELQRRWEAPLEEWQII